jgi:hypothetical protein
MAEKNELNNEPAARELVITRIIGALVAKNVRDAS